MQACGQGFKNSYDVPLRTAIIIRHHAPQTLWPSSYGETPVSPELGPEFLSIWHIEAKSLWVFSFSSLTDQPSSLNNQLVSVDCKKGTRVQADGSQTMLRIAEPDARFSGFYSMQKQNHLQADNFYQTV